MLIEVIAEIGGGGGGVVQVEQGCLLVQVIEATPVSSHQNAQLMLVGKKLI